MITTIGGLTLLPVSNYVRAVWDDDLRAIVVAELLAAGVPYELSGTNVVVPRAFMAQTDAIVEECERRNAVAAKPEPSRSNMANLNGWLILAYVLGALTAIDFLFVKYGVLRFSELRKRLRGSPERLRLQRLRRPPGHGARTSSRWRRPNSRSLVSIRAC
jgi:hypothetical protein